MSMKVLVSDPDWRFAAQAINYLESHAHLVVSQADPEEAAEHAERWQPDLVILAAENAEKGFMDKVNELSSRPAILLTENMDRYDRAWRMWQKGGDELLMKPIFSSRELQQAIVMAMENAATGAREETRAATA
jgi:CheY-like chemotaxis protein